jgi:hypothetical protein
MTSRRRDNRFLTGATIFFTLLACAIMWLAWTAQVMTPDLVK